MVKFVLMKSVKIPMSVVRLLLGLWMGFILALQLILYPPPPMLELADTMNLREPLLALQERIKPFFRTTDINLDFMLKF